MPLLFEELPIVFPFFDDKEKQARFNINTDEPCGASLLTPKDALLPFQVRKTATSEVPTTMEILSAEDDTSFADISNIISTLRTISLNGSDYLTYLGDRIFDLGTNDWLDMIPGMYYVKMTFPNGEEWFSEVFKVPLERWSITQPEDCKFLKLEFSNSTGDIPPIHYNATEADRLVQTLYLDSNIYNTDPEIIREGKENGDGELLASFEKVLIKYYFRDVVPDFVKLALSTVPIHDNVILTTEYAKRSGQIMNVTVESKAEANGYFSEVDIHFEQDLAMIKRGCDSAMDPGDCPALPSNVTLGVSAVPTTDGVLVKATLPIGMFADIYSSLTSSTGSLSKANVYKSQLNPAGVEVPFIDLVGEYINLKLKTFNCVVGHTTPFLISPALAYHPKAMAFFHAIENDPDFITAGGSLTSLEKDALNQFVIDLIGYGLLTKAHAIWPFLGLYQDSQKYNLVNPVNTDAGHRLTFPNGAGFTANGLSLSSSFSQYADTHFSQQVKFPGIVGASMFLNIQTAGSTGDRGLMGAYNNNFARMSMEVINSGADFKGWAYDTASGGLPFSFGASSQAATYAMSRRTLSDASAYYNGFPDVTNTTPSTGGSPSANIYIGAINGQLGLGYLNGEVGFAAMAEGLTNGEVADFVSAIGDYNTNLGR